MGNHSSHRLLEFYGELCAFFSPMIGLGGDQVERATVEHNLEPYHVNEHKNEDAWLLISRLEDMTKEEAKHVTIKLFLGLNARTGTKWGPVLDKLTQIRTNIVLWHRWIS